MSKLIGTKRMQSLMDCISTIHMEEGNTLSKIDILKNAYSDSYKSHYGSRPTLPAHWTYIDYLNAMDRIADNIECEKKLEEQEKLFAQGRIAEALNNTYSNSPFANFYKGVNNG